MATMGVEERLLAGAVTCQGLTFVLISSHGLQVTPYSQAPSFWGAQYAGSYGNRMPAGGYGGMYAPPMVPPAGPSAYRPFYGSGPY